MYYKKKTGANVAKMEFFDDLDKKSHSRSYKDEIFTPPIDVIYLIILTKNYLNAI